MTTMFPEEVPCGNCGKNFTIQVLGSTNSFGSPDLDTRSAPMERYTINTWVNRCPHCGYCSRNITESTAKTKAIIEGDEYREQLSDKRFSDLVNDFLCEAILAREQPDSGNQFWALLSAAWACDDDANVKGANTCREMASEVALKCQADGAQYAPDAASEAALLVDILRRSGKFEEARKVINDSISAIDHDVVKAILVFQGQLMDRNDRACHTIDEAMGSE